MPLIYIAKHVYICILHGVILYTCDVHMHYHRMKPKLLHHQLKVTLAALKG